MKKLLLIGLLIVGCEEYASTAHEHDIPIYQNLSWAFQRYGEYYEWNADSTDGKWMYQGTCFFVDSTDMCETIKPWLELNDYYEDTTIYHNWPELRLPNSQVGLEAVTIELISFSGLVNPYEAIDYYEYLEN